MVPRLYHDYREVTCMRLKAKWHITLEWEWYNQFVPQQHHPCGANLILCARAVMCYLRSTRYSQLLFPNCMWAVPWLCPLQLLFPNYVHFSCCSPVVFASAAAPQLHPLQLQLPDCIHFSCCSPINLLQLLSPNKIAPTVQNTVSTKVAYSKWPECWGRV